VVASPSWDFLRSAAAIRVMVDVASEHAMSAQACLLGSGLWPADLRDPDLEVEASQELAVVRNIVRGLDDEPGVGTQAGRRITLGMLGIVGFALISSRTARDAIMLSDRNGYGALVPMFMRPWADEHPEALHIILDEAEVPADVMAFVVERDLACCLAIMQAMFAAAPPVRVTTTLDAEHGQAFAHAMHEWPVATGAARNAVIVENRWLDQPLPNADEHTIHACERFIQGVVARRAKRTGVAARVRSAMLRQRPVVASLEDLAAERHVDPRTLRRQLAAEGTSFRALADEVRETLAVELLTAGLTVDQVADRLGYCDAATFSRAFRRWTGETPGSVARRHQQVS
jgi:AraC-like DNA-binding protein